MTRRRRQAEVAGATTTRTHKRRCCCWGSLDGDVARRKYSKQVIGFCFGVLKPLFFHQRLLWLPLHLRILTHLAPISDRSLSVLLDRVLAPCSSGCGFDPLQSSFCMLPFAFCCWCRSPPPPGGSSPDPQQGGYFEGCAQVGEHI
jgi:hypothetical protein